MRAERSLFNPASCDVVRLFFPFGTWATSASSAVAGGAAPRLHVLREVPSYALREVPSIFWPGTPDVRLFLRGCPFTVNPFSPDFRSTFVFFIGPRDDSGMPCRAPSFLNKGPCDTPCSAATLFCKSGLLTRKSPRRRASWPRSPVKPALLATPAASLSAPSTDQWTLRGQLLLDKVRLPGVPVQT